MKCVACGLPLSPSRNNINCPRCGTPVNQGQKSWGQAEQPSAYQSPMAQTAAPQAGQMWLPGSNIQQEFTPGMTRRPDPLYSPPPPRPPRNNRIGFIVAGLCVFTGGILLILVYLLAMGSANNTTGNTNKPASTHVASPTSPATPSPTATTYPGQQYIHNAQMSSVQPTASQPAQPTTTFKVKQKAYVVFDITSGGQSGAICLTWYFNGKAVFPYQFAVGAHTTSSYAYATYGNPGSAYVELYWASNISCTDKVLAQHVDFTVTA
jgi:hypothetical protein